MVDSGVGVEVVGRIEVSLLCAHCVLWGQAVKQSGSHVLPFPGLCSLEQAVPCLPHDLAECTKLWHTQLPYPRVILYVRRILLLAIDYSYFYAI